MSDKSGGRGRLVFRVSRKRHVCLLPGWWMRWKLDLDYGSRWECYCGKQWEWESTYESAVWRQVVHP